ncbi:MAG: hypothetical protein HQ477_12605 [Chloroflexi bacterium]|nr:hypothetical protein [Chloroflexota bacterium]
MSIKSRTYSLLNASASSESNLRWGVLGTLYILGILYWMHSFGVFSVGVDGGALRPEYGHLDWPRNLQVLEVIKDAFQRFELPYVSSMELLETNQLLAIPEVPITPQQILLLFVSVDSYVIANAMLMYSVGFIGLVLFIRRFRLSAVSAALLFSLFMFNGHVISHLAIGHTMWVAYYLLPFLMYLIFRMVDRSIPPQLLALLMGGVFFGILAQGALHIFVFAMVFSLAVGVMRRSHLIAVIGGVLIALILDLFRLLPSIIHFDFPGLARFDGYSSPFHYVDALLLSHDFTHTSFGVLKWWEYDSFIGISGTLLMIGVLGYVLYRRYFGRALGNGFESLAILPPIFFLFLLSFGGVTGVFYDLELPLDLNRTERVPSRFFLMALVPTIFLTTVIIQRLLDRRRRLSVDLPLGGILGLGVVLFELGRHALKWRIVDIESKVVYPSERGAGAFAVETARDSYQTSVEIGLVISAIAIFAWIIYLARFTQMDRR